MKVYLVERLFGMFDNDIYGAYIVKELAEEKCRQLTKKTGDSWVVRTCPLYLDDLKVVYNEN